MIKVIYAPSGQAVPDHKAETYARALEPDRTYSYSTENMIYAIRCLIKEKYFPCEVVFVYDNVEFRVGDNGRFIEPTPAGFGDYLDNFLDRLIGIK